MLVDGRGLVVARHRPHEAIPDGFACVQEAESKIAHQPLEARTRREVDTTRMHIQRLGAGGMHDVHIHQRAIGVCHIGHGLEIMLKAVVHGSRRDLHQLRVPIDEPFEITQVDTGVRRGTRDSHIESALPQLIEVHERPFEMQTIRHHIAIAAMIEFESAHHEIFAGAGARDVRDLRGFGVDELREQRTWRWGATRRGDRSAHQPALLGRDACRIHGNARDRVGVCRVEIGGAIFDGKVGFARKYRRLTGHARRRGAHVSHKERRGVFRWRRTHPVGKRRAPQHTKHIAAAEGVLGLQGGVVGTRVVGHTAIFGIGAREGNVETSASANDEPMQTFTKGRHRVLVCRSCCSRRVVRTVPFCLLTCDGFPS